MIQGSRVNHSAVALPFGNSRSASLGKSIIRMAWIVPVAGSIVLARNLPGDMVDGMPDDPPSAE